MIRSWPLAALTLALLTGCGGSPTETDTAPDPVATVRTALATTGTSTDSQTIYGVVDAGPGAAMSLAAQSEAIVVSIAAPTGTAVRAGQIIAILRPTPATRLELAKAASDAAAASSALSRAIRLRGDGLASDADVETARAAATSAGATRASLASRTAQLVLHAPAAGTVQNLTARPGDVLAAGSQVATIAGTGDLRARFGVDTTVAQRLRAGQTIRIAATSAAGAPIDAPIVGVDPQADATTRLASVFARVPPGAGLGVGEAVQANVAVGSSVTGISIPYAALLDDGGKPYVFTVDKGVAHRVDVVPGSASGDRIAILNGLSAGARVVTEGGTALEDGMKVREPAAR